MDATTTLKFTWLRLDAIKREAALISKYTESRDAGTQLKALEMRDHLEKEHWRLANLLQIQENEYERILKERDSDSGRHDGTLQKSGEGTAQSESP